MAYGPILCFKRLSSCAKSQLLCVIFRFFFVFAIHARCSCYAAVSGE